jgi:hypothetical protein
MFMELGLASVVEPSFHVIFVGLKEQIRKVCQEDYLVCGEGEEQGGAWMEKVSLVMFCCS